MAVLILGACAPSSPRHERLGNAQENLVPREYGFAAAENPPASGARLPDIRFQIIYVIHGDAGYTYYDQAGKRRFADTEAVAQADEVARNSPAAEIFVFHQKPAPILWFFKGGDGVMRHYRRGKLVKTESYDRATREDDLATESALFRKYAAFPVSASCPAKKDKVWAMIDAWDTSHAAFEGIAGDPLDTLQAFGMGGALGDGQGAVPAKTGVQEGSPMGAAASLPQAPAQSIAHPDGGPVRIFLYFGHEIPVTGEIPYSRSRPDMAFSVASFARGLEKFGGPECPHAKPFSLVVLSACHGGTPAATKAVAPFASYILASPGELHLSYLDTRALSRLARQNPIPFETAHAEVWGRAIALESFARLRKTTSTAITLALYDTEKAAAYLEARRAAWDPEVGREEKKPRSRFPITTPAYRDCAENPSFGSGGEEAGATVYYHAPRFGSDKLKVFHSGWECPAMPPLRMGLAP